MLLLLLDMHLSPLLPVLLTLRAGLLRALGTQLSRPEYWQTAYHLLKVRRCRNITLVLPETIQPLAHQAAMAVRYLAAARFDTFLFKGRLAQLSPSFSPCYTQTSPLGSPCSPRLSSHCSVLWCRGSQRCTATCCRQAESAAQACQCNWPLLSGDSCSVCSPEHALAGRHAHLVHILPPVCLMPDDLPPPLPQLLGRALTAMGNTNHDMAKGFLSIAVQVSVC